jgi:hypothetical protein
MDNLEKFFAFLNAADAVTVDDGAMLPSWEIFERNGELTNQVARFSWTDGEYEFSAILDESGIANGTFDEEGQFVCEDHENERTAIRFYKVQRITNV